MRGKRAQSGKARRPGGTVGGIYERLGWPLPVGLVQRVTAYVASKPRGSRGETRARRGGNRRSSDHSRVPSSIHVRHIARHV